MTVAYDAILFDFDGVLVDSEPVHYECWRGVVEPYGFHLTWEDYAARCIGISDHAMIRSLCRIMDRDDLFDPIWSQYGAKKEEFRRRMIDDLPMPEPLRRLILELEGPRLAVVSSSGRLEIEPVLEAAGIRTRFAVIVTGEDVEHRKPAPDPYLKAAALLGARRPLVVEDSVAGIASGRAAGFDVVEIPHPDETARLVMERLRDPAQVPCSTPVRPRRTG